MFVGTLPSKLTNLASHTPLLVVRQSLPRPLLPHHKGLSRAWAIQWSGLELHPQSERLGSNQRPPRPKRGALPAVLRSVIYLLQFLFNPSQLRSRWLMLYRLRVAFAAGGEQGCTVLSPIVHVFTASVDMVNIIDHPFIAYFADMP